ncbi:glycerol-3-phosphate acyltransferase 3-like [Rhopilema esculentum]|uniref:glycerol-3-phosphate acyltransferase 3-like n=1 Tax=Rhopilema esculentum TaxID=499914 RepID=UPI0031E239FA
MSGTEIDWALVSLKISILYFLAYFAFITIFIIAPATLNVSMRLRERYIAWLLKVFDFGRKKIQANQTEQEADRGLIDRSQDEGDRGPKSPLPIDKSFEEVQKKFDLSDSCDFVRCGMEVIMEDEVTKRFDSEELQSWNLMTRTNLNYHFISWRLTVVWVIGFFVRYFILLPTRLTLLIVGISTLASSLFIVNILPQGRFREYFCEQMTMVSFRIMSRGLAALVRFHNQENKAKGGGICVANHTSPIDAILLTCDNCYALIGQMQGGLMGFIQKILLKAQHHIFFERSEIKDRHLVVQRMKEHVEDASKKPILIFPEGTCINNTSVMMFKKGSFEVGGVIYPVAIKYDPIFGNAFWNSMQEPMAQYIFNMITSWAIVCDVWYLPPMQIQEGENSIQFANRVKKLIARQGGLVDLVWDGQLKRSNPPPSFKAKKQEDYASKLKFS